MKDIEDIGSVSGYVHSTDSLSCVDGPGVRYLVFMQGCQMRCTFCSNPDTWRIGTRFSPQTQSSGVAQKIRSLLPYLAPNRGGVTVSGGEPMLQSSFLEHLFREVHRMGLTTCIDTCGRGEKERNWDAVLPHTDYVLFCIKHIDPVKYSELTGCTQEKPMAFARELERRKIPFFLRYVLIPGHTDADEDVEALLTWAKKQPSMIAVELLPYHELGKHKWEELGLRYKLEGVETPGREDVGRFVDACARHGVRVNVNTRS